MCAAKWRFAHVPSALRDPLPQESKNGGTREEEGAAGLGHLGFKGGANPRYLGGRLARNWSGGSREEEGAAGLMQGL